MQNKQQSLSETVTAQIWELVIHARGSVSPDKMFTPVLAVLYSLHKGYGIRISSKRVIFPTRKDKLYCDLLNLIPKDKDIHFALARFTDEFLERDCFGFWDVYSEVLRGLFDLVSSVSGRSGGEFFTPSEITKLMAYIVNKEKYQSVFDPFCGTASIINDLVSDNGDVLFVGQEINYVISIYARLNAEARYGRDDVIANVDSIKHWNNRRYQAVVSCPPMGLRLSREQLHEARMAFPDLLEESLEEIVFDRPLFINNAAMTVTLVPYSFCFTGSSNYKRRQSLIDRNVVDTIIALPENILYQTSVASIIIVCKRFRSSKDPIRFINAEEYYQGNKLGRKFDYERFVKMIEGDASHCVEVTPDDVRKFDYNLSPALYINSNLEIKPGQHLTRLEEILTPIDGSPLLGKITKGQITSNDLSKDFIEVLLNHNKKSSPVELSHKPNYRIYWPSSDKRLLVHLGATGLSYGINTDGGSFVCPNDVKVYKIKDSLVTPEYLAYSLINHLVIGKSRLPFIAYMKLPIVLESITKQREIVKKISQQHAAKARAEQEADAKRLGVKTNISDLEHMLQTTQANVDSIIDDLGDIYTKDSTYQALVKSLKDNVEYMKRVIRFSNATISSEMLNKQKYDIEKFLKTYCSAWRNFSGNYFTLSLESRLGENKNVLFDKTYIKLMLDSVLTNVERHGFNKIRREGNLVEISLSLESYQDKPFVVVRISNNGEPIKEGFTIDDYITRGRYSSNTGRSGLGGYHIYKIAKEHNGFLYIDSNKVWNVIIEVLLPVENVDSENLVPYENECI